MASLSLDLVNQTVSNKVYAYVTGQALDKNNALFLLRCDGRTPYYPTSPSSICVPLEEDCAVILGPPGSTNTVKIPHLAGGRLWFSIDKPLKFMLNPGPGLVEPSVANPSDPNINIHWGSVRNLRNTRPSANILQVLRVYLERCSTICQYQLCRLRLVTNWPQAHQHRWCGSRGDWNACQWPRDYLCRAGGSRC